VFGRYSVPDAEPIERDAARMKESRHVMVRRDEQRRWVGEWLVVEQHTGVDVTVRRDDRKVSDLRIESPRDVPDPGLRREEAVRTEPEQCFGHAETMAADAAEFN